MTRWQYASLTYEWNAPTADEPQGRWRYDLNKLVKEVHGEVLDEANRNQDSGAVWIALGDDGWELVQHVTGRTNQYAQEIVAPDARYTQVYGRVVGGTYLFKRQLDDS